MLTTPRLTPELMAKAQANALWAKQHFPIIAVASQESFGTKIKRAVQARQGHRRPPATSAGADDSESFGTKLAKAVQARLAGKQRVRR